jgi:hypothetical protein
MPMTTRRRVRLRFSARGANHTRYTDIDQKQRPAANLFGVNGDPTGRDPREIFATRYGLFSLTTSSE